jgi:hypothetical protein
MGASVPVRGRLFFDLSIDLATGRLLKAMQAIGDSQLEDRDVARGLVSRARAVRSFVEAGEPAMADLTLMEIEKIELGGPAAQMVERRIADVRRALR